MREALQWIRQRELPVRVCTDSTYVIGVLTGAMKAKANLELVAADPRRDARLPGPPLHQGRRALRRPLERARRRARARGVPLEAFAGHGLRPPAHVVQRDGLTALRRAIPRARSHDGGRTRPEPTRRTQAPTEARKGDGRQEHGRPDPTRRGQRVRRQRRAERRLGRTRGRTGGPERPRDRRTRTHSPPSLRRGRARVSPTVTPRRSASTAYNRTQAPRRPERTQRKEKRSRRTTFWRKGEMCGMKGGKFDAIEQPPTPKRSVPEGGRVWQRILRTHCLENG